MAKILVIDTDSSIFNMLQKVLAPLKHELFYEGDIESIVTHIGAVQPDMIFLDEHICDLTDFDLISELRDAMPKVKIILLGGISQTTKSKRVGILQYVKKPFKIESIIDIVKEHLKSEAKGDKKNDGLMHARGMIKNILLGLIIGGIIIEGVLFVFSYMTARVKSKMFTLPYSNPTSIAFDGNNIWITDWLTQTFYMHEIDELLTIAHTYYLPGSHPTGIAFDGSYLWSTNSWESVIYKHALDESLTVVETYQSPGKEPSGIYWDGVHFWVCDLHNAKVYKTKVSDEGINVINEYESPGNTPVGMFYDGENYWLGDAERNCIFKLDSGFKSIGVYKIPKIAGKDPMLASICWDGCSVWACSDKNEIVQKISLKQLVKQHF